VFIQVDAGDGEKGCGEIAEASFTVEDGHLLLTIGNAPPTLHALRGGDPVAVAKGVLREKTKLSAFNRRLTDAEHPEIGGIA
jgi:hypothetical protein